MFYITTFSLEVTTNLPLTAILIGFISASFSIAATNGGIGSYPVAVYIAFSMFSIARNQVQIDFRIVGRHCDAISKKLPHVVL